MLNEDNNEEEGEEEECPRCDLVRDSNKQHVMMMMMEVYSTLSQARRDATSRDYQPRHDRSVEHKRTSVNGGQLSTGKCVHTGYWNLTYSPTVALPTTEWCQGPCIKAQLSMILGLNSGNSSLSSLSLGSFM